MFARVPVALAIFALCLLRLVHLEADTPPQVGTGSMGLYVDEGYKTLSPRNLVLHGVEKWHEQDEYKGWLKKSPATQWSYYLAFRLQGPSLGSARLVSVAWFFVFLVGYVHATAGDHSNRLVFVGLFFLGLVSTLFFFSRIALFETAIIACLYWPLFLLRALKTVKPLPAAALVLPFLIFSTLAIKSSCLVYFFPMVIGLAVAWGIRTRWPKTEITLCFVILGVAGLALLSQRRDLLGRLDISPRRVAELVYVHPLMHSTSLLVAAGLLCALHVLLTDPPKFLGDSYRASLFAMVVGGPPLLGLTSYAPLRYFVPFLPAYLLLVLEWLHLETWRWPCPKKMSRRGAGGCVVLLSATLVCLFQAANNNVLKPLGVTVGDDPGVGGASVLLFIMPLAVFVSVLVFSKFREALHSPTLFQRSVAGLLVLSALRSLYMDGAFLLAPSYESREISSAIGKIVPEGKSIAGDWAPLLTLGTQIRSLYALPDLNNDFSSLRPDYFLFSETAGHSLTARDVNQQEGVTLGPPVFTSSYVNRKMILYPVQYAP